MIPHKVRHSYRSLRYPNYRLFFIGQSISLIGSWLSLIATSWLVYRIAKETNAENAAAILGSLIFAQQIPVTFVTPLAGVWIDRLDRKRVLMTTQTIFMLSVFWLAYLDLSGQITLAWVYSLSLLQGFLVACDIPARQAIVVDLIEDRADLPNAIALNSSMVPAARLIGPSIAGFLIYHFGEGYCFLIDGVSYLPVLVAYIFIRTKPREASPKRSAWVEFKEGVSYVFQFAPVRAALVIVALTSIMFTCQSVFLPIVADRILHGGERELGFLWASSGAGALAAGIYLASRTSIVGLGEVMVRALAALGVGLTGLGLSKTLAVSMASLVLMGGGMVLLISSANMGVQTLVEDRMRARLMAIFNAAFMGLSPFWGIAVGVSGDRIGIAWTLGISGLLCVGAAYGLKVRLRTLREHARPVLASKGIILPMPEI